MPHLYFGSINNIWYDIWYDNCHEWAPAHGESHTDMDVDPVTADQSGKKIEILGLSVSTVTANGGLYFFPNSFFLWKVDQNWSCVSIEKVLDRRWRPRYFRWRQWPHFRLILRIQFPVQIKLLTFLSMWSVHRSPKNAARSMFAWILRIFCNQPLIHTTPRRHFGLVHWRLVASRKKTERWSKAVVWHV